MSSPTASIGGLASGLDTATIIAQLVQLESLPLNQVAKSRQKVVDEQSAWTKIQTSVTAFADAARDLTTASRLHTPVLKSSSDAVTVSGALPAGTSLTLSVRQLATSAQYAATGYRAATDLVGAGRVTTATGAAALGIARVRADAGAATGAHTLTVTQASAAATLAGAAGPLTVDATNDELTVTGTDGLVRTVTVAAGAYTTSADLAAAVTTALTGTGVRATATGTGLTLSSTDEGSTATLTAAGTFAAAAGVAGTAAGTDAIVDVDGATTTLTHLRAGATVTAGTMTLTLADGHLATGKSEIKAIDATAATTVADLASLVSGSGTGLTASVVTLAPGSAEILMTSKATGSAGAVAVDLSGFATGTGVSTVRAAQDAQVMLGSQLVTRSSNTITDLVPGATLTLAKTTPVGEDATITSEASPDDLLAKVKKFTTAYNAAYDAAMTASKPDPTGAKIGPLNSNSQLRSVINQLRSAVTGYAGTGDYTALAHIGVRLGRDGHLSVDEPAFKKALADSEPSVTSLLARTGTGTDTRVTFLSATDTAAAGPQAVVVTAAAERASITGAAFGTLAAGETLTITYGTATATFTAAAGATAADLATSLSEALRTAGIGVTAAASAGALTLTSTAYGSAAAFSVTSTGAGTGLGGQSATGTDVAGTINGAAATGAGQRLTSTGGVSLRVAATGAEIAAAGGSLDLGTLTYSKGIAGAAADLVASFKNTGGVFSSVAETSARRLEMYDDRKEALERHIEAYQLRMQRQFTALETALARLSASTPNFASLANLNNY